MISKGLAYEELALHFLLRKGLQEIQRNFHTKFGEIDLIMKEKNTIVFVEVRFRKTDTYGSAAESVTPRKQNRIIKSAKIYLSKQHLSDIESRFDVIAISPSKNPYNRNKIDWHKAAFTC